MRVELDKIPFIHVPQHAIIKVVWTDGNYQVEHILPNIDVNIWIEMVQKMFETMKQYQFNNRSGFPKPYQTDYYSFENLQSR